MTFCPRSITFTIPGLVGVQVTAVENAGNIDFTVDIVDSSVRTGDLRALFFHLDEQFLSGLSITYAASAPITEWKVARDAVLDLGNGANLMGYATPFDIGVEFGSEGIAKGDDLSGPISFTLDGTQDLTLDAMAHVLFGARVNSVGAPGGKRNDSSKGTFVAPAAPDANDDKATTHEDQAVTINVLANDTDADGDALFITDVEQPQHGTVIISADRKSLTYIPARDYAGLNTDPNSVDDSFIYCVSDGNGGQDSATVDLHIIPVADLPTISFEVLPWQFGDPVNLVRLKVTATQSDDDGSEFIDRLAFGGLPGNVTMTTSGDLNPAGQDAQLTVFANVTLPTDVDSKFDLSVTAYAQEKGIGDPDEASATANKLIELDVNSTSQRLTFSAEDQSIWSSGGAFAYDEEEFIGIDEHFNPDAFFLTPSIPPVPVHAFVDTTIKLGFNARIHLQAGDIDAVLPFDITVKTLYNKTTDVLQIAPATFSLAPDAHFDTTGPEGSFALDFIAKFAFEAGIDFPIDLSYSLPTIDESENIFSFDSGDAKLVVPLPAGLSITIEWPHISTASGAVSGNNVGSQGASNNFLELGLDVDQLAATLFPLLAFIDPEPTNPDNFEWLDIDLSGGLNFIQVFQLIANGFTGALRFEDGHTESFNLATGRLFQNASSLDGSDADDLIQFVLGLTPEVSLDNSTRIGFNVGYSLDLLKNIPIVDETLFHADGKLPIADLEVFNSQFALSGFNSQDFAFAA